MWAKRRIELPQDLNLSLNFFLSPSFDLLADRLNNFKNLKERIVTVYFLFLIHISFTEYLRTGSFPPACLRPHKAKCKGISPSLSCILTSAPEHREDRIEWKQKNSIGKFVYKLYSRPNILLTLVQNIHKLWWALFKVMSLVSISVYYSFQFLLFFKAWIARCFVSVSFYSQTISFFTVLCFIDAGFPIRF